MNRKKGFTLVELLITIAIIGLLITIVLAGLGLIRSKARDATRIADIKQLNGAIENYFDSCYKFPTDIYSSSPSEGLVPDCKGNIYLSEVPKDPQGEKYKYFVSDIPYGFHLCADLEFDFGNNKGKAGKDPIGSDDPCNGTNTKVFDVVGGALK